VHNGKLSEIPLGWHDARADLICARTIFLNMRISAQSEKSGEFARATRRPGARCAPNSRHQWTLALLVICWMALL